METRMTAAGNMDVPRVPKFLALNAAELEDREETDQLREYIKLTRIEFSFPEGLAVVPVFEECRALCDLENFDTMYDLTMQYLVGKPIHILIINDDYSKTELGSMVVQDKMADLRQMDCIANYPILVNWLTEFMAAHLSKRFPLPATGSAQPVAETKKKARKKVQQSNSS